MLTAAAAAAALVIGGVVITNQVADQAFQQAQAEQLDAITAAADTRELTAEVAGGGTATLVWSNELGSAALMVDGIAPLPDSKTYQFWYIDENGARPAGVFDVATRAVPGASSTAPCTQATRSASPWNRPAGQRPRRPSLWSRSSQPDPDRRFAYPNLPET